MSPSSPLPPQSSVICKVKHQQTLQDSLIGKQGMAELFKFQSAVGFWKHVAANDRITNFPWLKQHGNSMAYGTRQLVQR